MARRALFAACLAGFVAFFALSVAGALLAAFGIARDARWGWVLGVLVAGGSVAGYLLSRSIGLPGFRENRWEQFAEPIGLLSLLVEGLFLVVAARVLTGQSEPRLREAVAR